MSPRTVQQYEEIRENKRNLILETALELFACEGYYTTSISAIAKKAGISKGLIYNYFESKEDIIKSIMLKGFNDLLNVFDPDKDGTLTKEEIRYFIENIFTIMYSDLHFWKLYFMVFMQPLVLGLVEQQFHELIHRSLGMMENYFRLRGYKDPESEAILLGAILDGIGFHLVMDPENFPVDKIKGRIIEIYC
jgi:AcrR family transcriptional regulator